MTKSKAWDDVLMRAVNDGIIPGIVNRVLLWGPPRTGKSFLPSQLFPSVERLTLHRQMPIDDLLGGWCLQDGSTVWADGPAVRAMRNGTPLVLDEIDQYSPECRCALHAICDDPAGITLANGDRVMAVKGYCVIGTTNALPSTLPDALYDRFDMVLKADTLSQGLQARLGKLAEPASVVIARSSSYEWSRPASVNLYVAASKLRSEGYKDQQIADALGLTETEACDFLATIAER
jgi:MoxR-like ATPase